MEIQVDFRLMFRNNFIIIVFIAIINLIAYWMACQYLNSSDFQKQIAFFLVIVNLVILLIRYGSKLYIILNHSKYHEIPSKGWLILDILFLIIAISAIQIFLADKVIVQSYLVVSIYFFLMCVFYTFTRNTFIVILLSSLAFALIDVTFFEENVFQNYSIIYLAISVFAYISTLGTLKKYINRKIADIAPTDDKSIDLIIDNCLLIYFFNLLTVCIGNLLLFGNVSAMLSKLYDHIGNNLIRK